MLDQALTRNHSSLFLWHIVTLFALLAVASGSTANAKDEQESVEEQPLFYPLPPDEPRLQLLAKFTTVLDLSSAKNKGFRDFVFGGEDNEAELVGKPYGLDIDDGADIGSNCILGTDSRLRVGADVLVAAYAYLVAILCAPLPNWQLAIDA